MKKDLKETNIKEIKKVTTITITFEGLSKKEIELLPKTLNIEDLKHTINTFDKKTPITKNRYIVTYSRYHSPEIEKFNFIEDAENYQEWLVEDNYGNPFGIFDVLEDKFISFYHDTKVSDKDKYKAKEVLKSLLNK